MNETLERALRTLPKYKSVDFGDKEDRISVAEIIELLMEKKYPIDGVGFGGYQCAADHVCGHYPLPQRR